MPELIRTQSVPAKYASVSFNGVFFARTIVCLIRTRRRQTERQRGSDASRACGKKAGTGKWRIVGSRCRVIACLSQRRRMGHDLHLRRPERARGLQNMPCETDSVRRGYRAGPACRRAGTAQDAARPRDRARPVNDAPPDRRKPGTGVRRVGPRPIRHAAATSQPIATAGQWHDSKQVRPSWARDRNRAGRGGSSIK